VCWNLSGEYNDILNRRQNVSLKVTIVILSDWARKSNVVWFLKTLSGKLISIFI
jgi:hypothetical protein